MKALFFIILVGAGVSLQAQSLKEALYGGKLRLDTGTVIRKGDDLSTKIDTSTKKPAAPEVVKTPTIADDGKMKGDSAVVVAGQPTMTSGDSGNTGIESGIPDPDLSVTAATGTSLEIASGVKDNNAIWKEYIDSLTSTLRTEVLPNKKIKGGDYSILIDYVIGLDGTITVNNVSSFPESSYLDQQVRERLTLTAPQLTPLLNSYGKPRKAPKKQTINLSK